MKKISLQEIQQIMNALFDLNIPVKAFNSIQELFNKLPPIEKEK